MTDESELIALRRRVSLLEDDAKGEKILRKVNDSEALILAVRADVGELRKELGELRKEVSAMHSALLQCIAPLSPCPA